MSGAVQFSNGTGLSSDAATFFWDNTNKRLGIGTATPAQALDVSGTVSSAKFNFKAVTGAALPSNGTAGGGTTLPTGAIMAFDLAVCPTGWAEYTLARGRFLRGIDNGAGNDPSGTRAAGNVQTDDFKSHSHLQTATNQVGNFGGLYTSGTDQDYGAHTGAYNTAAAGGAETRPKNVAVLFCRKN